MTDVTHTLFLAWLLCTLIVILELFSMFVIVFVHIMVTMNIKHHMLVLVFQFISIYAF